VLMTNSSRADWRPPTIQDRQRLHTLLRDVAIQLRMNAEMFEEAEHDLREIGGEHWPIGIGRYPDRAARCRELATWVEDELGAMRGGHTRKVPLDERGMVRSHAPVTGGVPRLPAQP
jgi:hypothetical protein